MKTPKILLTITLVFSSFFPLAASLHTLDFQQKPHIGHFSDFSADVHPITLIYLLETQQGTELFWCTMHIDPINNMVNGFVGTSREIQHEINTGGHDHSVHEEKIEDKLRSVSLFYTKGMEFDIAEKSFGYGVDFYGLFSHDNHNDILKESTKDLWKDDFISTLQEEDHGIDIFEQFNSAAHYDNNSFASAAGRLNTAWKQIRNFEKEYKATGAGQYLGYALGRFARITHAVADFYSHSNYVERKLGLAQGDKLRTGQFSILNHFLGTAPFSQYNYIELRKKVVEDPTLIRRWGNIYTHRALNKDYATSLQGRVIHGNQTLFDYAKEYAIERIERELKRFKKEAPCIWETLKK